MNKKLVFWSVLLVLGSIVMAPLAHAGEKDNCKNLPSWDQLKAALTQARTAGTPPGTANGGLNLDMWGTIVDRDGIVCAVAFTGADRGSQWPGSRVISAQKANTANAFSLPGLSLSTANLYTATQPGGSLFGLQLSNPVDTDAAYKGDADKFGSKNDPMVGLRIGGINVFGGGLALYDSNHNLLGALGVSGDTSCADHNIAYRTRSILNLDWVPAGVSPDPSRKDNIIFDIFYQGGGDANPGTGQMPGVSLHPVPGTTTVTGGFGHPSCHGYNATGNATSASFASTLPPNK